MIILDTNILSELTRVDPNPNVVLWIASQGIENLYTTCVTQAEVFYGIAVLPDGRRRTAMSDACLAMFEGDFRNRILPFDSQSALRYARIVATRRAMGKPIEVFDAMIAAIADASAAIVATRDVDGFSDIGISVINPFSAVL